MVTCRLAVVACVAVLLVALSGGCSTLSADRGPEAPPVRAAETVQLPDVPVDAIPVTGTVLESWPSGQPKSERYYHGGTLTTAIYYASDGTPVYEMFAENEQSAKAATRRR